MKSLTFALMLAVAASAGAYDDIDWYQVDQQRQLEQLRYDEERRFRIEQDRYDQYDYQRRLQDSEDSWRSNPLCEDNQFC